DVTIEGVVTASAQANDLGYVYIQDPNSTEWAGIALVEGDLTNLVRGDLVEASGVVEENFSQTRLSVTGSVTVISSGNPVPAPIPVDPNELTDPTNFLGAEPFESMLITLENPNQGAGVFVVEKNADGPTNNFAEYRVGSDPFDFTNGARVLAGRQTGSAFSSLWFSHINDSTFILDNGVINTDEIDVCVVNVGDTMASMSGILTYSFGNYKLLPRNNADVAAYSGVNCPDGVSTALAEDWEENQLTIFPNPANEQVQVVYNFLQRLDGQVELLDLTGRSLSSTALRGYAGTLEISTSAVPAGTYVVRFTHQNELIGYEKLIITH
ncbi:MAG: T9SS type A sorting domain-containing protein, partial [Bacteroidota bacterium]